VDALDLSSVPLTDEARLRLAQEVYGQYRTRCFWFMKEAHQVTSADLPAIVEGLKLHGGHQGWQLAQVLCRSRISLFG
jgi:hypothetical protein